MVSITTRSRVEVPDMSQFFGNDEFFQQFFGAAAHAATAAAPAGGTGPGIRVSSSARPGAFSPTTTSLPARRRLRSACSVTSSKTYHASIVGRDALTDTALIKLDSPPGNLQVATLGDSSTLQPGDWVMAIGNPFQLGPHGDRGRRQLSGPALSGRAGAVAEHDPDRRLDQRAIQAAR